jgi:hypothetical protein
VLQNLKSAKKEILAIAALAAMVIWFCDEMIFSRKVPIFRDLVTYFYPIKFSVAEAFKAGSIPLWDRHMATGFPIMAAFQSAVFYPPSIVFYLLPFFAAARFTFVFHYMVAALGSYILLRSWRSPVYVSLIGAILFTFGGTTVSLSNLLNHFQSAVWLPWVIYFWEQTVRERRWKDIAAFSIVALCQLFAGSPEIFLLSIGLVVLDTVRLHREEQIHGFFRVSAILLGSGCVIVGLGMIQLLPTAELIMQSRRDQPIHLSEALSWSLRPSRLIGLLLPTLEADSSLAVGVRLLLTQEVPFLLSHYIGVIGVLGSCCWFRAAHTKERAIILALIGCSLLMAFGSYTPVYPFLYEWVPVLRVMRFPEKYCYLTFALLVFTTVRGLRQMDQDEKSLTSWVVATSILAAWLVAYLTFRIQPELLADLVQPRNLNDPPLAANPTTIAAILVMLEKHIAVSLTLTLLFGLNRIGVLRWTLLRPLLVITVFLDLSSANKPLHFLRDETLVQSAPRIIEKPPADGRLFYYPPSNNVHPSFMRVAGNPTYEKATEIPLNNLLPNAGMLHGFEYFQDIDALGRRSYTDFLNFVNALPADKRGKLLQAINVKYVVAFHSLQVKGLELVREFPEHYSKLYEVTDPVPRAYIAQRAIYDLDPKTTLERMASDGFDPLRDVILDVPIHTETKGVFQSNAAITLYQNNRVLINTQLSQPGVLVLTDAFYPGWKVFVGGDEHPIRRANYLFRGVELPAGNHEVEFIYDPISFKIGLLISLLTAIVLIVVPCVAWNARRVILRRCGTPLPQSSSFSGAGRKAS